MAENRCDFCGKYEMLPFNCKYCGGVYCSSHRLPEHHECAGLRMMKSGAWKPPAPLKRPATPSQRRGKVRIPSLRLPFRGYYAYMIIGVTFLAFVLQIALPGLTGALALTRTELLARPWTPITYIFLHADPMHILFNMLALFFFGPLLERQIGSEKFLGLYLGSGLLAGLVQVLLFGGTVVGASGAVFGILGALTVLMPDLRIFVYFVPMKILYAVILFAAIDILLMGSGDAIAHGAHLVGLAAGLLYGYLIKKSKGTIQTYRHA